MNFLAKILIILLSLLPAVLWAEIRHAPKNFKTSYGFAVFVDFKNAQYNITYDPKTKSVSAVSQIVFESMVEGLPVFDLVENPSRVLLDGEIISSQIVSPLDKDTWFRIAVKNVKPGLHTLEIVSPITENINFLNTGVSSAFWFTDLGDRSFLEAYLPANFEYDQYQITLNLDFKNLNQQKIYTNGTVTSLTLNRFKVEFPETYTSSSLYFHTAPMTRYQEKIFLFKSIDGRDLPVVAYTATSGLDLEKIKMKIEESLDSLESKYGAFPHQTLTVFIAGSGGMEYCGATMSDVWALNHELTHSYFARGGFMPANGNAGWIDEAITTWSDRGAAMRKDLNGVHANMAGNSEYRRYTHSDAYSMGKDFMAYLNYKFQSSGGLSAFLNQLVQTESFKPMTTEEFIKKMSDFYAEDIGPLFKNHVYSSKNRRQKPGKPPRRPAHLKMTIKEMKTLL